MSWRPKKGKPEMAGVRTRLLEGDCLICRTHFAGYYPETEPHVFEVACSKRNCHGRVQMRVNYISHKQRQQSEAEAG